MAKALAVTGMLIWGFLAGFGSPCLAQKVPEPIRAQHGMVVTANYAASRVGADILKHGGNAVDAAVAVALTLAVTHPSAGNLGGGGFMLVRMADGRAAAIDYRETAPAGASRDMYLDAQGKLTNRSLIGYRASGVPGTVAGLALALEKYGTMPWRDVVEPARKLAAEGIVVTDELARSLRSAPVLGYFPETRRIFLRNGRPYERGQAFTQKDLAATLKRLQQEGPREFYEGKTAHLIADDMAENGGLITLKDLRDYRPVIREPLRGTYRGVEILTMPPPSSGGLALIEMLNILSHFDLAHIGSGTPQTYHLMIEAMRRAFADRAEFMGDPDFVKMPVRGLLSPAYAADLAKGIDPSHATPVVSPGMPARYESPQTTHFSIVDAAGNCVSNTSTLNTGYGSGVTIHGAGFLMNNEMDDFTSKPGSPNVFGLIQGEANAIAPGKRPLSSMTPTIALKDGKPWLVLGTPGGPTIINSVLEVFLNVVDHGMNIRQAVEAPRLHHQWMPDEVVCEPKGFPQGTLDALEAMGHKLSRRREPIGEFAAILIDPQTGQRTGWADPRAPDGLAAGE